jgi:response regulator of citrate/malate metabolism
MHLPQSPQVRQASPSTLLLEDDSFMAELTVAILNDAGIEQVYIASSVAQALILLKQHQLDLLICDLAIPDSDGFEFLQKLAECHYAGGIIILSGMAQAVVTAAHRVASAHGLKIIGAFAKPLTTSAIETALAQLRPTDRNRP